MTAESGSALLSIGEVSELTGLSVSTLRFYEQQDLFVEPVARDGSARRRYTQRDVAWLRICSTLRTTGMPIGEIRQYVTLARSGPATVSDRHALLSAHADRVREQIAALEQALTVIPGKADTYGDRIALEGAVRADRSWQQGTASSAERPLVDESDRTSLTNVARDQF